MATDPKPGMIAETRGPTAVKNLALQQAFGSCPVVQLTQENAGRSIISPLQERPGFSLVLIHPTDSEEGFYELLIYGVLRSSHKASPERLGERDHGSPLPAPLP
jgi:hypothetical protein